MINHDEVVGANESTPASRIESVETIADIVSILNETGGYEDPTAGFVSAEQINQRVYDLAENVRNFDQLSRRVADGEADLQSRVDKAWEEITTGENGVTNFPPLLQSVINRLLSKYSKE